MFPNFIEIFNKGNKKQYLHNKVDLIKCLMTYFIPQ